MNITLSADPELVQKARRYAQRHGTTLNGLVREYLREVTGEISGEEAADEFWSIATTMGGDSRGKKWPGREEIYHERLDSIGSSGKSRG